ncbi:MAG: deoxyribodipyrimidine photo-lyase [Burkholderiaceae bacterium]|nr:deoxyribodipyrimidine photo-lyase [Burkholderiaceae bacterium]
MTKLCWFRTDLRLRDQPALTAAMAQGDAIGLFIISSEQWAEHADSVHKVDFWLRALRELSASLAQLNVPLKILNVSRWADVPQALLAFCQKHGVTEVHCNREFGVNERRRDRASYTLLAENAVSMQGHHGGTLLVPGTVRTGSDNYYRVFTPFSKACREKLRIAPHQPLPVPKPQSKKSALKSDGVPDSLPGWSHTSAAIQAGWPASEDVALARLETFANERMMHYKRDRDFPSITGTSTLSPYLAAGLVSAGQCWQQALRLNQGELGTGDAGIITWMNELLWREFYQHLLHGYPSLSMHQPMRPETNAVQWRDAPADFEAWCQAKTGVPIVDAAMRQLLKTGWMHNRLRMVVAMYLTKNLLIDWRLGERFFMQHLIDGELAANNGGWQWSASTGADSAPYFRVFNPISQSEKFDPEGAFIRHWCPELASLSNREIHDPSPVSRQSLNYPQQIVDLRTSRVRAIEAFSSLR